MGQRQKGRDEEGRIKWFKDDLLLEGGEEREKERVGEVFDEMLSITCDR